MKIYKTQQEVEKDIVDGVLTIHDDVTFMCSISVEADICARNIDALNINAWDINAWDICARNIDAQDISAHNINAWNISAENIDAQNIKYYAFCFVYYSIACASIFAKRSIYHKPTCLEGTLTIRPKEAPKTSEKKTALLEKIKELQEQVNNL